MRTFEPAVAFASNIPWVCSKCLQNQRLPILQCARYATRVRKVRMFKGSRRTVLLATAGGTLGTGTILAFSDDLKHGYSAAQRTGRVITTLALCMNE